MKNLLVVMETHPAYEERIRSSLVHSFDYRTHHLMDVANDMLKHLGYKPTDPSDESRSLRDTLIKWNDEHAYHRHRFYNALWERARPLTRIGRQMALLGLRENDLEHLLLRTTAEKVAVHTLRVLPVQPSLFPPNVQPTGTAEIDGVLLSDPSSTRLALASAFNRLGIL